MYRRIGLFREALGAHPDVIVRSPREGAKRHKFGGLPGLLIW